MWAPWCFSPSLTNMLTGGNVTKKQINNRIVWNFLHWNKVFGLCEVNMDLTDIENMFFKYSSSWVHFLNLPGVIFDVLEKYFFYPSRVCHIFLVSSWMPKILLKTRRLFSPKSCNQMLTMSSFFETGFFFLVIR